MGSLVNEYAFLNEVTIRWNADTDRNFGFIPNGDTFCGRSCDWFLELLVHFWEMLDAKK